MVKEVKATATQMWKDFVNCAGVFVSFCGMVGSAIAFVNSLKPESLEGLPTKSQDKKSS